MVVVVISWELSIPASASLKDKRSVIRSLKDRIRHKYNVSIAETRHQDVWTRAELTVALVATDRRFADSVADSVDRFVAEHGRCVVMTTRRDTY